MITIGIALALGFIIGDTIRRLALAIVACIAATLLLVLGFTALPLVWTPGPLPGALIATTILEQTFTLALVTGIGLFFGRRRKQKGWGKP